MPNKLRGHFIISKRKSIFRHLTLKDILLRCEPNFTDVEAVLVIDVSSVFFVATAVKIDITAAKADATAVKTDVTAVTADATAANTVVT